MSFWNNALNIGKTIANVYAWTPLPFAGTVGKLANLAEDLLGEEEEEEEEYEDGVEEEEE